MHINYAPNVNVALAKGLGTVSYGALITDTRNGKVVRSSVPVTTVYTDPLKRVLFSPMRNANPFFHFMESLWMLAGRNDLPWLAQFNKRMAEYSDDGGITQPAAYGHRWRKYFGCDNLVQVIEMLRDDPTTRRAVLAMWDSGHVPYGDLGAARRASKDVPCNTHAYFSIVSGELQMMICCRSNDLWWGAHGANAVHFSILQEYVAASLGVPVGILTQVSNDYHLYSDIVNPNDIPLIISDIRRNDHYFSGKAIGTTLFYDAREITKFNEGLEKFMLYADPVANPLVMGGVRGGQRLNQIKFPETGSFVLDKLAYPMLRAWDAQKTKSIGTALQWCSTIGTADECDWRIACHEWVQRKFSKNGDVV